MNLGSNDNRLHSRSPRGERFNVDCLTWHIAFTFVKIVWDVPYALSYCLIYKPRIEAKGSPDTIMIDAKLWLVGVCIPRAS
ncbi:hypothetical protein CDAR_513691 [Caerostris darwini]|uniref:Uncharacterized protein n=1 Tax=Caerostris darwini TaxID=1538125 RepID=A0AAV4R2Y0_9ARAC|nr:hypothetical protein CDAR_513691 [Caerostris darwini]